MAKTILIFLLCSPLAAQSESYDLRDQVSLLKELLPNTQVVGIFIGANDEEGFRETINALQRDFNIRIALAVLEVQRSRDVHFLETRIKELTLEMLNKDVSIITFGYGKDKTIQAAGAIKVVSDVCAGFQVPVFSPNKKGIKYGCTGQFTFQGEWWHLQLSHEKAKLLEIALPENDDRFMWME